MAWSAVTWAYKDLVTSAKLAQMQENIRTHDHRSDGTQGDPASVIFGPTFGAADAAIAATVTTTLATITLPATLRKSTLWVLLKLTSGAAYQRIVQTITPTDARITVPTFTGFGTTIIHEYTTSSPAGSAPCMFLMGYPVSAGAATGTAMTAAIAPYGAGVTQARMLYWLDS